MPSNPQSPSQLEALARAVTPAKVSSFDYVRRWYGVPAKRGLRVTVDGKPGTITRGKGGYIMVRFDGRNFSRPCHPTWRVDYSPAATLSPSPAPQ